jgi:hypothetical protein
MVNDSVGYICGVGGVILKTLNGGGYITTDVNKNNSQNPVIVYGNPAKDEINIKTQFEMQNAQITIYNSFGQAVKIMSGIRGNFVSINTSSLSKGLYFIEFTHEEIVVKEKFMLQ